MQIGQLVKRRRQELDMTQADLARNLCTQAMVSKIERGLLNPSSKTLEKIARRLEVPVSYFYGENGGANNDEQLMKLEKVIRSHLNKFEYETVDYLLDLNQDKIHQLENDYYSLFFDWINGMMLYYGKNSIDQAIDYLTKVLMDKENVSEFESIYFDILVSLANLYYEKKDYSTANEHYELALSKAKKEVSFKKKAKLLYNYALNLDSLKQYKDALEITLQGIDLLMENESFYMLGSLYYLKGYLLNKLTNYEEAVDAYQQSVFLFDLTEEKKMLTMAKVSLSEVREHVKEEKH